MFGALVPGTRRPARPAARFVPRLEALDGRALPGGGGVTADVFAAGRNVVVSGRNLGEEIPTPSNTASPGEDRPGEEIPTFTGAYSGPAHGPAVLFGSSASAGGDLSR